MFLSILLLTALPAPLIPGPDSDGSSNPPASSMRALLDMIPAEAVAVSVFPGPSPATPGEAEASTAQGAAGASSSSPLPLAGLLLDQADRMGLFAHAGTQIRVWTHVLAAMAVLCDYPHAVAILGASARARADGGHELSGLRAALIIRTDGQNDWVTKRIQHLINTYANDQETSLERRTVSGQSAVTLRDRRLPSWATMTWGAIGDHYVITIGTGAFERIAQASAEQLLSLGRDPWAVRALDATEASAATWSIFVRFETLLQGADRNLARKIGGVQASLHLDDIERGFWTYRRDGRSIEISGYERRNGHDASVLIAGKHHLRVVGRAVIPDQAGTYAIIRWNPRAAVRGACNAYLASRGPTSRQSSRVFWQTIETESGVSIENDIVAHLGQYIIMHDDPKPFLGLPIARTIVIPISGDATELAGRVDRFLEYTRKRLNEAGWFQIQHDPDGTWYLQLGLLGPALRVTDHWLVISFSPEAVRHNVARLPGREQVESTPNPGPSGQPE